MAFSAGCRAVCVLLPALLILFGLSPPTPAQQIQYYYDALSRLVGVVDAQGNTAEYVYDALGNLLQINRYTVNLGQAVSITFVTPGKGPEGAAVQVLGQGFSPNPADNTVMFNGVLATVTAATMTALQTSVPLGATTGPVTVTTPLGSAISPEAFHVLAPVGISPSSVSLYLGMTQQFTATAPVVWAVDNIRGGNATLGTITPDGLYTTPRTLPTASGVTVTATHVEDPAVKGTASISLGAGAESCVARPVSVGLAPAPTQASPWTAAPVSIALSPGQANPWVGPRVSLARSSTPTQATPLVAPSVALARAPVVLGIIPASGRVGSAVSVTVTGTAFTGATSLTFERNGSLDSSLTTSNLAVSPDGTTATATATIASGATTGPRVVRIAVPGATSTAAGVGSNVFTVTNP